MVMIQPAMLVYQTLIPKEHSPNGGETLWNSSHGRKKPVKKSPEKIHCYIFFIPGPPNNKFKIVGNGDVQLFPM